MPALVQVQVVLQPSGDPEDHEPAAAAAEAAAEATAAAAAAAAAAVSPPPSPCLFRLLRREQERLLLEEEVLRLSTEKEVRSRCRSVRAGPSTLLRLPAATSELLPPPAAAHCKRNLPCTLFNPRVAPSMACYHCRPCRMLRPGPLGSSRRARS